MNYRFLLTTSHKQAGELRSYNVRSGGFRLINLFGHPFGFGRAGFIEWIGDYP
jgi:hypothetical protein